MDPISGNVKLPILILWVRVSSYLIGRVLQENKPLNNPNLYLTVEHA